MSNQEIIDKHLKEFHETHRLKVPIELNPYIHRMIEEAKANPKEIERPLTIGALTDFLESGVKCEINMDDKGMVLFRLDSLTALGEFDVKYIVYESKNEDCIIIEPIKE